MSGIAAAMIALCGCATPFSGPTRYAYFTAPDSGDAWSRKIRGWQERERAERGVEETPAPAPVAGSGEDEGQETAAVSGDEVTTVDAAELESLRVKYEGFLSERRRTTARDFAEWIQLQARQHYVADGALDHWATLEETLRSNGDDCDGLELLTYHFLRRAGFGGERVFRAIVYRPSDGQHHMVTLWFEHPEDPWVIDPTGAMTSGMPRMSEVPGWVPLKVFDEDRDYTVRNERYAATLLER